MGRARQPVSLLVYKGKKNLTKKDIEERAAQEVKAASDNIKPPTYLPRDLKKEFKKTSNDLLQVGIMTNLDVDALARFLLAKKMYLEVTDALMKCPPTVEVHWYKKDEYGEVIEEGDKDIANEDYSALLINQDKLFKQCRVAASDLGLTIASRCRLVVPKSDKQKEQTEEEKRFGDV
jgi:P27 family predicted phage terminase small subunit